MNYNKKSIKKAIILMSIFILLCGLSGCTSNGPSEYEPTNKQEKEAKKVADSFIKKIMNEDYDQIKKYVYLPDGAFIRDNDIAWYIPRSELADLVGAEKKQIALSKMTAQTVSVNEGNNQNTSSKKLVYVTEDEKEYAINVLQDKENHWKVYFNKLYHKGFSFIVKKSNTVYINDIEIPEDYISKSVYNTKKDCVAYSIPYVPNREFEITTSGGAAVTVTPDESNVEIK